MMAMMMMGDMMNMGIDEDDLEDMENEFGFKMPGGNKKGSKKSKTKSKKEKDDDGWETDSDGDQEIINPKEKIQGDK